MNSRNKGARGEREFAGYLREAGFDAERNDQTRGGYDNPDIFCEALDHIHFEIKRTEKLSLYDAMSQAKRDCCNRIPVVAHRRNHCEWLVVMRAEDWFAMVREALPEVEQIVSEHGGTA